MTQKYILSALLVGIMAPSATHASSDCENQDVCIFDCALTTNDKCTATLDKNSNTLTLKGYGNMKNYGYDCTDPKCYSTADWGEYESLIKNVVVENESDTQRFSSVGNFAFAYMRQVTSVELPDGLSTIGHYAFAGSVRLQDVNLPESLESIGKSAFNITAIKDFVLPENVVIGNRALGTRQLNSITYSGSTQLTEDMILVDTDSHFPEALSKIYCNETNSSCQALLNNADFDGKIAVYEQYGNAYYSNGKFYQSPNDIGTPNYIKKRIYTIDEANKATGKTNTVTIRYR